MQTPRQLGNQADPSYQPDQKQANSKEVLMAHHALTMRLEKMVLLLSLWLSMSNQNAVLAFIPSCHLHFISRTTATGSYFHQIKLMTKNTNDREPAHDFTDNKKNKVIADIAALGAKGAIAYVLVEIIYWLIVPLSAYLLTSTDDGTDKMSLTAMLAQPEKAAFQEALKTPLLVAVLLWPNSWIRNGLAMRLANALGAAQQDDVNKHS